MREQLVAVWEATGHRPPELVDNHLPDAIAHVWGWFVELSRTRTSGAVAANPISYTEIAAWSALTGRRPDPFEVECIAAIDALVLKTSRKDQNHDG